MHANATHPVYITSHVMAVDDVGQDENFEKIMEGVFKIRNPMVDLTFEGQPVATHLGDVVQL
eukprot:3606539-Rhodomonas_salina.1